MPLFQRSWDFDAARIARPSGAAATAHTCLNAKIGQYESIQRNPKNQKSAKQHQIPHFDPLFLLVE